MGKIGKVSIKRQFQIVSIGLCVLYLCLSFLSMFVIVRLNYRDLYNHAEATAQHFNKEMESLYQRMDTVFANLLFDQNTEHLLQSDFSEETPIYLNNLSRLFSFYEILNDEIKDIAVASDTINWSNYISKPTLQTLDLQLQDSKGTACIGLFSSEISSQKNRSPSLLFGHSVYGMHEPSLYGERLGSIFITVDPVKSYSAPQDLRWPTYFLLLDEDKKIVPMYTTPDVEEAILHRANLTLDKSEEPVLVQTTEELIYLTYLPEFDFYMVSIIDKNALTTDMLRVVILTSFIILVALVAILLMLYSVMRSMVNPINDFSNYILSIKDQPLSSQETLISLSGGQEIQTLTHAFNDLMSQQKTLTAQLHETTVLLYEAELEQKQAELNYLKSQISPHFLSNMLESMKGIALANDVPEIAHMASAIGQLFQYNLHGDSVVRVQDEVKIIKAYLALQQARFPEKIEIIYHIPENVQQIPILKFILQPLVENAVYHGLEPKLGPGILFISGFVKDSVLFFSVQDDGVGMPKEALRELQAMIKDTDIHTNANTNTHIGLMNVNRRLVLQYGPKYPLNIESTYGEGTKVTLRIPVKGE